MADSFDMKKVLGQAQDAIKRMAHASPMTLDHHTEGVSGGGMVKLNLDGEGNAVAAHIDPMLLEKENIHHLENLLVGAINDALGKYKEELAQMSANMAVDSLPEDTQEKMSNMMDAVIKSLK